MSRYHCPSPDCTGTLAVELARGHYEAHCTTCQRAVPLLRALDEVERLREALTRMADDRARYIAEAWDEGYEAADDDTRLGAPAQRNPYRAALVPGEEPTP